MAVNKFILRVGPASSIELGVSAEVRKAAELWKYLPHVCLVLTEALGLRTAAALFELEMILLNILRW